MHLASLGARLVLNYASNSTRADSLADHAYNLNYFGFKNFEWIFEFLVQRCAARLLIE
jgi:hypothetical protein